MKDEKKFLIDQLRNDKIIYATEACAIGIICFFLYFFSNQYFRGFGADIINSILVIIVVGYGLYMGIGNFKRLKKIQTLEKELKYS